jgi:hypothetical protein
VGIVESSLTRPDGACYHNKCCFVSLKAPLNASKKTWSGFGKSERMFPATRLSRVFVNGQDDTISQAIQQPEEQNLMIANEITGLSSA